MHLPVKLICKKNSIRRDGTSSIYIQYCFSAEKRTLLNTQITIPPAYWNTKRSCIAPNLPEDFASASKLNKELVRMRRIVKDLIVFAGERKVEDIGSFVKKTFKPEVNLEILRQESDLERLTTKERPDKARMDLFHQIDDYIQSKKHKVCKGMLNVYNHMKQRLKAFQTYRKSPITFDSLDYNFYDQFIQFLTLHYVHKGRKEVFVGS